MYETEVLTDEVTNGEGYELQRCKFRWSGGASLHTYRWNPQVCHRASHVWLAVSLTRKCSFDSKSTWYTASHLLKITSWERCRNNCSNIFKKSEMYYILEHHLKGGIRAADMQLQLWFPGNMYGSAKRRLRLRWAEDEREEKALRWRKIWRVTGRVTRVWVKVWPSIWKWDGNMEGCGNQVTIPNGEYPPDGT